MFPPPNVTVNELCSCLSDARGHFFWWSFFTALKALHHLITCSPTLTNWASRSVVTRENILSLFATGNHASVCTMGAPDLTGNESRLYDGYCILSQTHTHELMKWLCTDDRSIPCGRKIGTFAPCATDEHKTEPKEKKQKTDTTTVVTSLHSIRTFYLHIVCSENLFMTLVWWNFQVVETF